MMTPKDEAYFRDLLQTIRSDLREKIPKTEDPSIFLSACRSVQDAQKAFDAAKRARDGSGEDQKKQAQDAVKAAEQALAAACEVGLTAATQLIRKLPLDCDSLDHQLVACSVLVEATPKGLAEYCARGPKQDDLVDQLLSDPTMMQIFLNAGGVRAGCYGDAMEIYTKLVQDEAVKSNPVLRKLAIGVSVELAGGSLMEFDTDVPVDPIARFQHYRQAHERGELDASFLTLSAFEMRYVINSNAPNDQLAWGRAMLRNYRPDQVLMGNQAWRYVMSVRTDVAYKRPTWTGTPRTYPMIISGGGQCGPRAWFGRFMLQSFGIPNWGVRQPGHAALTHWTPSGWVVCLGATWKFCTWEGRWGPNFLLETQARACGEDRYMSVQRLEWIANVLGEPLIDPGTCIVHPDRFWGSLALMQKTALSKEGQSVRAARVPKAIPWSQPTIPPTQDDATMVIEATSCTKPAKSTNNVIFMKSFLGGTQMHHQGDDTVEYCLEMKETATYDMTVLLVSVHRDCENTLMLLTLEQNDTASLTKIDIPYTMGMWQETEPVSIELKKGTNVMSFTRQTPNYGLTLKRFLFRPNCP